MEKLKTTNSQIIRHAYENQLGIKKIHKCCLATIETKDIDSLFRFLCSKATEILGVDKIKIVVSEDMFSHSDIANCVFKPDREVSKYLEKIGITTGKPVRLKNVPEKIDIVDVFRPSKETPGIAKQAKEIGSKVLWLQYGIHSDEAKAIAESSNMEFISNRCIKQEYQKIFQKSNPVFPALKN